MKDRLFALRLFAVVARTGSVSRAAAELHVSQPTASRTLSWLEDHLGVRLVSRTTRAVTLTSVGTEVLERLEPLIDGFDALERGLREDTAFRGELRVALPASFGRREVLPRLSRFLDRHPALRLDLKMTDRRQDLVAEGVDVALRIGKLDDSTLVARRIGRVPRLLLAAPSYLARVGRPASFEDLADGEVILGPGTGLLEVARHSRALRARCSSARVRTPSNDAAVDTAAAGLGFVASSLWGCRRELDEGSLVSIPGDWRLPPADLHIIYPQGGAGEPVAAARDFGAFMSAEISAAMAE